MNTLLIIGLGLTSLGLITLVVSIIMIDHYDRKIKLVNETIRGLNKKAEAALNS